MANLINRIDQLQKVVLDSLPEATQIALRTILGAFAKRIFEFGLDANNLKIGYYSQKPMLTGSKNFRTQSDANAFFGRVKGAAKSKSGKTKGDLKYAEIGWVTVKTATGLKRLAIVPGGYKEFRQLNQLQNQFVDLNFTGDLFFSVVLGNKDGHQAIGFNNAEQYEKAKRLEAKYKTAIFTPTKEEIQLGKDAFNDYLKEQVQNLFSSW